MLFILSSQSLDAERHYFLRGFMEGSSFSLLYEAPAPLRSRLYYPQMERDDTAGQILKLDLLETGIAHLLRQPRRGWELAYRFRKVPIGVARTGYHAADPWQN